MNSITKKRIADYIFEFIKTKNVNQAGVGTPNIGGIFFEHYIRDLDAKMFSFVYSTYNKDTGKRNNDYQTFNMSFEQFNTLIKNG